MKPSIADNLVARLRKVRTTPIDDIVMAGRPRTVSDKILDELMASIGQIGLQTLLSIIWRDDPSGNGAVYPELVAGYHRLEAWRRLGFTGVPILSFEDARAAHLWEISENLHRGELMALERAEHIAESGWPRKSKLMRRNMRRNYRARRISDRAASTLPPASSASSAP